MPGFRPHRRPDQNLSLQIDAIKAAGCERICEEKASGSQADRPELMRMIDHGRESDTIVIWQLDRLGQSLAHLVQLVTDFESARIGLISLNDPIDTTTAQGRLVFGIFASLAEFDRSGEPVGSKSRSVPSPV
jgi:DNA invertase Pin-like site-specific DNA recombinase